MRVAYRLAALLAAMITGLTLIATAPASAAGPGRTLWNASYPGTGNSGALGEAVSPDGSTLFVTGYTGYNSQTGATGGAAVAYNAATGAAVWTQATPGEVPGPAAVSPDGSMVFAIGYDTNTGETLTIAYNAATGAVLWTQQYAGGNGAVALAVSPDGSTLYVMTKVSGILAYATATGHLMWASPSRINFAVGGVLSPDGSTLFITGRSATVAYRAATGARLWVRRYGSAHKIFYTSSVAVSPGGSEVYVAGYGVGGDVVRAYDSATGATRWTKLLDQTAKGSDQVQTSLGVSPDGATLFVSGEGGRLTGSFWVTQARDASTGRLLWSRSHGAPSVDTAPFSLAVNPNGSAVYVTGTVYGTEGESGKTVAYNAATGTQLWAAYGEADGLDSPTVVAPDGSTVFVSGVAPFSNQTAFGATAFRS